MSSFRRRQSSRLCMGHVCRADPTPGAVAFLLLAVPAPRGQPGPGGRAGQGSWSSFFLAKYMEETTGAEQELELSGEPGEHVQHRAPCPACAAECGCQFLWLEDKGHLPLPSSMRGCPGRRDLSCSFMALRSGKPESMHKNCSLCCPWSHSQVSLGFLSL